MPKITLKQKTAILKDLSKIIKVRVSVESFQYQKGIVVREVLLESLQKTSETIQEIFRAIIQSNSRQLIDFMMLTSEEISLLNRAASINGKLNKLSRVKTLTSKDLESPKHELSDTNKSVFM